MFTLTDKQTQEYSTLKINKFTAECPSTVQTPDSKEAVLDTSDEKTSSSTITTACNLQIHHNCVASTKGTTVPLSPTENASTDQMTIHDIPLLLVVQQTKCNQSSFCRPCVGYRWGQIYTRGDFKLPQHAHGVTGKSSCNIFLSATIVLISQCVVWVVERFPHQSIRPSQLFDGGSVPWFFSQYLARVAGGFPSGSTRACCTCMIQPLPTSTSRCATIWMMHIQRAGLATEVQWCCQHGHQTSVH